MTAKKRAHRKAKSSPDFPQFAQKLVEASRNGDACKLPPGLYVVATPIGNLGDISLRALVTLASADAIACEDTRISGGMLARYGIKAKLVPYHDHNADDMRPRLLAKLAVGEAVALISDAGMPLIADPGFKLVRACFDAGHAVTVIPGANAALTALAGSGLPTDRFTFIGFLPPKSTARRKMLEKLRGVPVTTLFYEAPQRLADTLADMAAILTSSRSAAVARELTKLFEETQRGTLGELAMHYAANPAKGEIVIVVGPADTESASTALDIDGLLRQSLRGNSVRDAVALVSGATGTRKSEVYARALAIDKNGK